MQLQAAADFIKEDNWKDAIRLVQHLLDGKPGELAHLAQRDGKSERYVNVHAEAERLLATLPQAGREVYQRTYSPHAAQLLDQARKDRDAELFARIVRRYLYTDAGPAALQELARRHYRGGRLHLAARSYTKLVEHLGVARWTTDDLYQATVAFHHKSTHAYADRTLKQLLARSRQNIVRLGERKLTVEQLRQEIARAAPPRLSLGWPIYRGNAERSAQSVGGPPFFEAIWRQSMLHDERDNATLGQILRQAEKAMQAQHQPIIPAFSPITVTISRGDKKVPLILYKNYWGIVARDPKTGMTDWASPSPWSLQGMLKASDARKSQPMNQWVQYYIEQGQQPQILFENSTVGTLSTDGRFVYAVDDLAVLPPDKLDPGFGGRNDDGHFSREIQEAISASRLQIFELSTNGKLVYESGDGDEKDPLSDCYVLGPPLPLDGLLYLLVEKKQQVCLACLNADVSFTPEVWRSFKLVSFQPLTRTRHPLREEPFRRIRAAHLAYSDGILVCPTNAGVILGVDLLSGGLAWVYPYRTKDERAAPRLDREEGRPLPSTPKRHSWKACAPILSDGKIVYTPPDDPSIHCLNLRDGSLLWSRKKKDDELYLGGVYQGKVLIVGTTRVQGLSLTSGETLWTLETGTPSGQGIASDDVYYLPLKESIGSKLPEICAIDMAKGRIIAHVQARPRKAGGDLDVPGNLLFFEDRVISLTPWEIVAYPLLKVKIARIDERLARNPNDAAGLTERGALRLDEGDVSGAIEDLHHALKNNPAKDTRRRARALLFQALTQLFQRDIREANKHLRQYEELTTVDLEGVPDSEADHRRAEQQRRQVDFFLLVARFARVRAGWKTR